MQLVLMKGMSFRHKPTSLIRSHHYCIYSICSVSLSVCVVVSVGQEGIINNFDLVVDGLSSKASDTPRLIGAIVDLGYQSFEATYIYIYYTSLLVTRASRLVTRASLLGARTLLVATCITSTKKLLGAKGIATRQGRY